MATFDAAAPVWRGRKRRVVALMLASGMTALVAFAPIGAKAATTLPKRSVDVIFDSSLTDTMATLATTFHKSTGLTMLQTSGASRVDAEAIAGKTTSQDVFVSEGAAAMQSLKGKKHGTWVTWFAQFGTTPLVLAYNPKSKFAKDLRTMPWYKVITMKGFVLGRSTPATNSSGSLAVSALNDAAKAEHLPALSKLAASKANVLSETDLLTELQQGHLAAAFFYGVDADTAGLRTVSLGSLHRAAPYVITILRNTSHEGAAVTFVRFLLRSSSELSLRKDGVIATSPPALSGPVTSVPGPLRSLFSK